MNKNFKVVFSKARGALMVVNELTSSVQAKGHEDGDCCYGGFACGGRRHCQRDPI